MTQQELNSIAQDAPTQAAGDGKALLTATVDRLDKVVQATQSQPKIRAHEIHKIKAEYLKAKYNLEIKIQQ